jgi:hypothetical protein
MDFMPISVIIDRYDHGRFVGRVIQIALVQSPPSREFIVDDDRISDDSLEVSEETARSTTTVHLVAEPSGGRSSAICLENRWGVPLQSREYVWARCLGIPVEARIAQRREGFVCRPPNPARFSA